MVHYTKERYDIIKLVASITGFDKSKIKIIESSSDDKRVTIVRFVVKGRIGNIIYSSIHGKYLFNLREDFDY